MQRSYSRTLIKGRPHPFHFSILFLFPNSSSTRPSSMFGLLNHMVQQLILIYYSYFFLLCLVTYQGTWISLKMKEIISEMFYTIGFWKNLFQNNQFDNEIFIKCAFMDIFKNFIKLSVEKSKINHIWLEIHKKNGSRNKNHITISKIWSS